MASYALNDLSSIYLLWGFGDCLSQLLKVVPFFVILEAGEEVGSLADSGFVLLFLRAFVLLVDGLWEGRVPLKILGETSPTAGIVLGELGTFVPDAAGDLRRRSADRMNFHLMVW